MNHWLLDSYVAFKKISQKITEDSITAFAAQSTYYIVICFFPFVMLLLTIIQYTPITKENLKSIISYIFPETIDSTVGVIINEIYSRPSITLISITAIITLWVAGNAFLAITMGLNKIYQVKERRNYFKRRATATFYTFILMILITLVISFFIASRYLVQEVDQVFPFLANLSALILNLLPHKFIITELILLLFFMFLYKYIPNRKSTLMKEFPGAVFSSLGWQIFSYLYTYYISFNDLSLMYGSLSTIVITLLWLYFGMCIILLGAELNTFVQDGTIRFRKKH